MCAVPRSVLRRRPLLAAAVAALGVVAGSAGCATTSGDRRARTRPAGPFWVDPNSEAAQQAAVDPAFTPIANQPTALTVTGALGDPATQVADAVTQAAAAGQTLVVQVYNIPHRDIGGGYSAGGAPTAAAYRRFTQRLAHALTGTPTVVVLEPDSLGQIDQLTPSDQKVRYGLLNDAVDQFTAVKHAAVYLDGANSGWTPAGEMAHRLTLAGVQRTQGFAVNVSNFYPTPAEAHRAERISTATGGAHYVVDTSRNGGTTIQGHHASWCNPPDRRLGQTPTTHTAYPHADAYLWVKHPGESDGSCAPGQPPAGQWYANYARQLLGLTEG